VDDRQLDKRGDLVEEPSRRRDWLGGCDLVLGVIFSVQQLSI
jgi:hypothetical protein